MLMNIELMQMQLNSQSLKVFISWVLTDVRMRRNFCPWLCSCPNREVIQLDGAVREWEKEYRYYLTFLVFPYNVWEQWMLIGWLGVQIGIVWNINIHRYTVWYLITIAYSHSFARLSRYNNFMPRQQCTCVKTMDNTVYLQHIITNSLEYLKSFM